MKTRCNHCNLELKGGHAPACPAPGPPACPGPIARCVLCAGEFIAEDLEGANGCPSCGTKTIPCTIADDVTIAINWHELRILGIWASNWADRIADQDPPGYNSRAAVHAILGRLQRQHPGRDPLTMLGEMRQLLEEFPDAKISGVNMRPPLFTLAGGRPPEEAPPPTEVS